MKKLVIVHILVLIVLFLPVTALADNSNNSPSCDRVVIYMIDKLSLTDLDPTITPYLWSLKDTGGFGLLNTVSGGGRTTKNVCCTISAGQIAVSSDKAQLNFTADEKINTEKAETIFYRNNGIYPQDNNIVINSINVIQRNNEHRSLGKPGQLGDTLNDLGYTTAVIGNSDRPGYYSRPGGLILMDTKGIVDNGAVGKEMVSFDQSLPPGYWSNYSEIAAQSKKLASNKVLLIEFGDLSRLDSMYDLFSPVQYQKERQRILSEIDNCISQIQDEIYSKKTGVYIISPAPSRRDQIQSSLLTPLIIVKPGLSGILGSYTTHRDGIITSTDIKNSILNCVYPGTKETVYTSTHAGTYEELTHLNKRAVFNYVNRKYIISSHLLMTVLLLLMAFFVTMRYRNKTIARIISLYILSAPLSLLLIANIDIFNTNIFLVISIFLSLIIALISFFAGKFLKINTLLPVLFVTISVLAVDLVANLNMIENSIMSYQIISGLRYYGLGNEYMGILIGATISFATLFLQNKSTSKRQLIIAVLFCTVIFLIAYPLFGINIGGTITASLALGYTFLKFNQKTISIKKVLTLVLGTVILISTTAIIDYNHPAEIQSHLGRSIELFLNGGSGEMLNIILRKLQMHLKIINYTALGWVFIFIILAFAYSIFKPWQPIKQKLLQVPMIYRGMQGIVIASIIAILFNDSGITTAGALALYLLVLFLYTYSILQQE